MIFFMGIEQSSAYSNFVFIWEIKEQGHILETHAKNYNGNHLHYHIFTTTQG
jgi:hypothetical protein